jgi:hypothetical protein
LVHSNSKAKEPQYFRYVPEKLRVVKFGCLCPPPPVNVVGVGTGANTLLYSRDGGLSWTGTGNSIFTEGNCADWNGRMWVAGGSGPNALAYSYDGINWIGLGQISTGPNTTLNSCTSIVWTGTRWAAVNGTGDFAISTDGITWSGFTGTNNGAFPAFIATNGSRIIGIPSEASGSGSLLVGFSVDGETWGTVTDSSFSDAEVQIYRDILWDGSKFIILVGSRTNTTISKFYSSDGITWSSLPTVGYVNGTNIGKTTGNLYISRGTNPDSTERSTNGTTWTTVTNPSFSITTGIPGTIFGTDKNIFVCGYNNNTFIYSSDGVSWINGSTGLSGSFKAGFFKA